MATATDLMLIERVSKEIAYARVQSPTRLREDATRECILLKARHFVVLAHALAGDGTFGMLQQEEDSASDPLASREGYCCTVDREKWGNAERSPLEWLAVILQRARLRDGAVRFKFHVGASFRLVAAPEHEPIDAAAAEKLHQERVRQGRKPCELAPVARGRALLRTAGHTVTPTGHTSPSSPRAAVLRDPPNDDFLSQLARAEARDMSASRDASPFTWRSLTRSFPSSASFSALRPSSTKQPTGGVLLAA